MARWLPGLQLLRRYELSWLRHDVVAGIVLTTMLVPVGIAYAEASGVPGIYGLYPRSCPSLRMQSSARAGSWCWGRTLARSGDPGRRAAVVCGQSRTRGRAGGHDGDRVRPRLHGRWSGAPWLHHRAAVEADSLRLHERHRAHGAPEPISEALRVLDRRERKGQQILAIGRAVLAGQTNGVTLAIGAGTLAMILILKRRPQIPGSSSRS